MKIKNKRISIKRTNSFEGSIRHKRQRVFNESCVYKEDYESLFNAINEAEDLDTLNQLGEYINYYYLERNTLDQEFKRKTHELSYLRDINKLKTHYTIDRIINSGYISDKNKIKFQELLEILNQSNKKYPQLDEVKQVLETYQKGLLINPDSGCEKRAHELGMLILDQFNCNLRTIWVEPLRGRLSPDLSCLSPDSSDTSDTDSSISIDSPPNSPEIPSAAQEILWNHHVALQFVDSEKIYDPLFPDEFLDQAEWLERINIETNPIKISYRYVEYLGGNIV